LPLPGTGTPPPTSSIPAVGHRFRFHRRAFELMKFKSGGRLSNHISFNSGLCDSGQTTLANQILRCQCPASLPYEKTDAKDVGVTVGALPQLCGFSGSKATEGTSRGRTYSEKRYKHCPGAIA
jgi:hypothetical protein